MKNSGADEKQQQSGHDSLFPAARLFFLLLFGRGESRNSATAAVRAHVVAGGGITPVVF